MSKEKFAEPKSAYVPDASPFWVQALQTVDCDPRKIWDHPNLELMRGYPVPDPFILCGSGSRAEIYLLAWLMFRSTCLSNSYKKGDAIETAITKKGIAKPTAQDWRNFLFRLGLVFGLKKEDNGQRPAKKLRTEHNFRTLFGYDIPEQCRPPEDIYWQGNLILSAQSIAAGKLGVDKAIWREVVWDLYENNFRVELLALDCCIFPRKLMPEADASARDEMVLSVFPEQSVFIYSKRTRLYHGVMLGSG